jgi:myo-inositol-hexaphosphate 3-phosphohydrolase
MAKDKSKVTSDGKGNVAVYGKSGRLAQVVVDGRVWNVGTVKDDRDARR